MGKESTYLQKERQRAREQLISALLVPGRISWGVEKVEVELKRFNDRTLNRDLEMLCAKVAQEQPRLPDGRRLLFRL
jgi:hypothetical protein